MKKSSKRGSVLSRPLLLLESLMLGKEHDRHSAARLLGVSLPTADRQLKAVSFFPGVEKFKSGNKTLFRFEKVKILQQPENLEVISACFGVSISKLFAGTSYEENIKKAFRYISKNSRLSSRYDFRSVERKFFFVTQGGESSLPEKADILDDIVEAVLSNFTISISYTRFNSLKDVIKIKPLSVAIYQHQFYVIGITDKNITMPYKLSRIDDVNIDKNGRFEYPTKAEYDPAIVCRDTFGIFLSDNFPAEDVVLRFEKKWRTFAFSHKWHQSQAVCDYKDYVIVKFHVKICPEFEGFVLSLGEDVTVLSPDHLREKIVIKAERILEKYRKSKHDDIHTIKAI